MSGVSVTIDDREVKRAFAKMERVISGGASAKAAWDEVGEHMLTATDDTFKKQGARDGMPRWKDLAPVTWALRAKNKSKSANGKILQVTARLRRSIWRKTNRFGVTIGTNVNYAHKHQFGVGVPARPFLFVTRKDWTVIGRILTRHMLAGFPRRTL